MASSAAGSLSAALETSIALCERFASSLAPDAKFAGPRTDSEEPSPLVLLNASVAALKSQSTKLSLLAITAPFTPSAVTTCLLPLNDSILTSLVTSALLTTPELFTPSFSMECRALTATALRDMQALLRLLEARSKAKDPKAEVSEAEKKGFTEATGKVWSDCDDLIPLATEGVPGHVLRKSKQWLELMKDAVKELEDWDPEEDLDDDDPFGLSHSDEDATEDVDEKERVDDRAAISAGVKEQALKVLTRIPQSIHVVIKQRLEKIPPGGESTPDQMAQLEVLLKRNRHISELIDEAAEGMYLGNLELCLKKAGEARALAVEVVQSVVQPFSQGEASTTGTAETKEDKYIKRALEWVRQVDPGGRPGKALSAPSTDE